MRDPEWNDHKSVCTALIHEEDAKALGLKHGDEAWITTEASKLKIPIEISEIAARGTITIPHGFGLEYDDRTYGVNVNLLTKNTHRDRLFATPLHKYVPCKVEKA
jgi:anaerobic selenocysteine-containing dehydrogenase